MPLSDEQFREWMDRFTPAATQGNRTSEQRFRPANIGYFQPNSTATEPVETKDGKTIYSNVFSFTNRVRVKAQGEDAALIAKNFDQYLLGKAERWYTSEINDFFRDALHARVDSWCTKLEARFRGSPGEALAKLEEC